MLSEGKSHVQQRLVQWIWLPAVQAEAGMRRMYGVRVPKEEMSPKDEISWDFDRLWSHPLLLHLESEHREVFRNLDWEVHQGKRLTMTVRI